MFLLLKDASNNLADIKVNFILHLPETVRLVKLKVKKLILVLPNPVLPKLEFGLLC